MKPRFYHEHPVFDEFSRFDPRTGALLRIDRETFLSGAPPGILDQGRPSRTETSHGVFFDGACAPTHTRFPRRVYLQITRQCSLECAYCFLSASPRGAHVPASAIRSLAQALGDFGLMEVRLTGGEPTMHPDLGSILEAFRASRVYVSIATNGLLSPRALDVLLAAEPPWIICSLDGGREAHDRIRPGTYDCILKNLTMLKEARPETRLRLTMVLTRRNLDQIDQIAQIARSLDAESVTVIPLRPQVRKPVALQDIPTAAEFLGAVKAIVRSSARWSVKMTTTIETAFAESIHPDPVVRKRKACAAGREATNVDYDVQTGRFLVYGCAYSPAADLNAPRHLRTPFLAGEFSPHEPERIAEVWENMDAWRVFREDTLKFKDCRDCSYRLKDQCVGSCPIQNIDWSQLERSDDLQAQLEQQLRSNAEWYCYRHLLGDSPSNGALATIDRPTVT